MIEKWLKLLAGFIVDAAFAKLGITDVDDLLAKGAVLLKAEMADELAKIDELPQLLTTQVTTQMNAIILQVANMVSGIPNQIVAAIQQFNPFK